MKTITAYVILQYCRHYGVIWTLVFLTRYLTQSGTIAFTVPGYGACRFQARKGTSDVRVFNAVILRRSYRLPVELPDVRFIVDAGANAGYSVLYFANAYPQARILAIEPDQANFAMLSENVKPLGRVSVFQGALWHVKTKLSIQNPDAPKTAITVGAGDANSGTVDTLTMAGIIAEHGHIDLLKIDIEGAEKELFEDPNLGWLDHVGCLVIELHDFFRLGCSMAFYRAISRLEFVQYVSGDNVIILFKKTRQAAPAPR
jgi:FkbM family methyltransferase